VCHGFGLLKQDDYFESILTTSKLSIIFRGSWGRFEKWLEPKIKPPTIRKFNLSKPVKCFVLLVLINVIREIG